MNVDFHNILKKYWGYEAFRFPQEDIIHSVWNGEDTLGLMPTGGGKSITFQVPTMAMDGICIVVTPLIALMKDQVDNLRERGIKAAAVYSGMSREEIITQLENCIFGNFKFLYLSPERLCTELFLVKLQAMNVCMLVVDESHCISQWGYDFRPSYLEIANVRQYLPEIPILALTATATTDVANDIQKKLLFSKNNVFRKSFERQNISYVVRYAENKIVQLAHILQSTKGTAIVYVRSRKETKEIATQLYQQGIEADYFHAGLPYEEKIQKQNAWKNDKCRVIVCTNAFGMGIDKPDVRLVVHYDLPNSLEEYYQEAGRAGRDGNKSYAIILYNKSDSTKIKKRIADSYPSRDFIKRVYEALGNYYQIAVGSGYERTFDFDLTEFCTRFHFSFLQAHHALQILQLAGYIEYTEEQEVRSRMQFLINRDEMYSVNLDEKQNKLLHAILRSYTGVFSDEVYIDESSLSIQTGLSKQEIYDMLILLSKIHYIRYIPQKKSPFVIFTRSREDIPYVNIQRSVYEERKQRFEKRAQAMLDYAENEDFCRSRLLLLYFDEKDARDCGVCDVCLKKKQAGVSYNQSQDLRELIIRNSGEKIEKVVDNIKDYEAKQVISAIRQMVDENILLLEEDSIYLKK